MLQKGDLCYIHYYLTGHPSLLAMYIRKLPDAMIERHVVYVFSTSLIEYVRDVEVTTITEL